VDWFRTPLVECFERGDAPSDVRLMAARGGLAVRVAEQLALLMLLVSDPDPNVAAAAETTISRLPADELATFLAGPDVPDHVRNFFSTRPRGGAVAATLEDHVAPGSDPDESAGEFPEPQEGASIAAGEEPERKGTVQRLAAMSVSARIKAAVQGTREERVILVRDPNRLVSSAVLSSPKLTESDVEAIARMTSVSDDVLRVIGTHRAWTKNYAVVAALTRNGKTPIPVALSLLPRLTERDVKMLSADRNIPEPVRLIARKLSARGAARRQ
jgi:hypothetical protein